ncbi:MAG: GTPase RsgA, partial [Planctomycetota bacterium]|nr:GTPase RsgA [Planctomycetota bacterium]
MKGRVYRIVGNSTIVRVGAEEYSCQFRGKLKRERKKVLRLVSVGDEVEFEPSGAGEGMIEKVLPRKTKLSRHDSFRPRFEQVIAANVDQLVVVHSATDPELNLLTIDRCTVMGEAAGLVSVLCINKDDLQDVRDS